LPAAQTVNVDVANGNNANDGLATGAGNALQTIQKAVDLIATQWDLNGQAVTISVVGNPTEAVYVTTPFLGGTDFAGVAIQGDLTTPSNRIWTHSGGVCLAAFYGAVIAIGGFELVTSSLALWAASQGAIITVNGNMVFGAAPTAHMYAADGGAVICNSHSYSIVSDFGAHYIATPASTIDSNSNTVTISGGLTMTNAFAVANNGVVNATGNTYSANPTGKRFSIFNGGTLITGAGAPATYFPGTVAGTGGTTAGGGFLG
jgi:hypothetical protein